MNRDKYETAVGLGALLHPFDVETFLNSFWGSRHLAIQAATDNIPEFAKQIANLPVQDILRVAEESVIVMHATTEGHYRGSRVYASEAFHFYESGMALYFNLASSFSDVLQWRSALAYDVGQPAGRCQASIFATPAGWITEPHFDANENFTLQLRGRKIWKLGENLDVRYPTDRFTCTAQIQERLKAYIPQQTLRPNVSAFTEHVSMGSVLYVPRGHWHSVESVDESVSLNFAINPETWATFVSRMVNRLFLTSPELREATTATAGDPTLRQQARAIIDRKLAIACELLNTVRPEQAIPLESDVATVRCPRESELIRRNRLATVSIEPRSSDTWKVVVTLGLSEGSPPIRGLSKSTIRSSLPIVQRQTTIATDQLGIISWIFLRNNFTRREVNSCFEGTSEASIKSLLVELLTTGIIYLDDMSTSCD